MTYQITVEDKNRFWSKVRKTRGCWLWTAAKARGYGLFRCGPGSMRRTHRFSWEIAHGPIPKGLCVCHRCDVPACVRPGHLFLGTQLENVRDRDTKGRNNQGSGEKNGRAKLSSKQVSMIRKSTKTQRDLASEFGVCKSTIGYIKAGHIWRA